MTDDEIVQLIQDDLRAAIASGHLIDFGRLGVRGSRDDFVAANYEPEYEHCSVCAIGAVLLGKPIVNSSLWASFGAVVGRSDEWVTGFYFGSYKPGAERAREVKYASPDKAAGWDLAQAIRVWAKDHLGPAVVRP